MHLTFNEVETIRCKMVLCKIVIEMKQGVRELRDWKRLPTCYGVDYLALR